MAASALAAVQSSETLASAVRAPCSMSLLRSTWSSAAAFSSSDERTLGEQERRAVGKLDQRLGALLQPRHGGAQLRPAALVEPVEDRLPFSR